MLPYSVCFVLLIFVDFVSNKEEDYCQDKVDDEGKNITYLIDRFKVLWPVDDWNERGYFTEEYICHINTHWLTFEPPSKISFNILAGIYLTIMCAGFIGNMLVIVLFIRCKSLRTPGNTLIINLAASDGLITLETPIFIYNCFHMGPALGDIACRVYGFVGGLSGTVSIVTLSAISLDRFFAIKYPLNRAYSNIRVKICLVITWLYSFVFAVIPALDVGLGKYTYEGYLTSCSFDYLTQDENERYFIFAFFIAAYVLPLMLIIFSYIHIIQVVSARSVATKISKDSFRHAKHDTKKQEIKLAFIVLFSISLWFIAWTPYSVVALLGIFGQKHLISPLSSMIPAVFCKTASCINPFVYALSHPNFKKELRNILCGSRVSRDHSKVWSTQSSKNKTNFESYKEHSDVDEEMIEIDPKYMAHPRHIPFETSFATTHTKTKTKVEPSMMVMLCLRPNFSNKSSAFKKMSRKWSAKRKNSEVENESEH